MPSADEDHVTLVEKRLRAANLLHLHARKRGQFVTIYSGPSEDPWPRARFRRLDSQIFQLDMPTHTGRWEPTPFQTTLGELLEVLIESFGWTLAQYDAKRE